MTYPSEISIRGVRVHNLKNISVRIPRDRLTVVTGPSGSGKSSLAFDTLHAEGQRRYLESMTSYAKHLLEPLEKPDIDAITGLSPTISIEQKTTSPNPRSTVGTLTEIYDHLRVLYARIGKPHCIQCHQPIRSQSPQKIVEFIQSQPTQVPFSLLAPIVRDRKGEYQKELQQLSQKGFSRVKIDGKIMDLAEEIHLQKNKKHHISVYIDHLNIPTPQNLNSWLSRLQNAVELSLKIGKGMLILESNESRSKTGVKEILLSTQSACPDCDISYPEPEPRLFSFNSPMGACPHCEGLGITPQKDHPVERIHKDFPLPTLESPVCTACKGARLKPESLHTYIQGENIAQLCAYSIKKLSLFFESIALSSREMAIADRLLCEIRQRLEFLNQIGLAYLSLDRSVASLSGGEAQRIRLASQLGSALVDVIYVLDEPSIGLHAKDHEKLIKSLTRLKDMGNTVVVVEHDLETIEAADWILDLGPQAGKKGGYLVAQGTQADLISMVDSKTGAYLRGDLQIEIPQKRRPIQPDRVLTIQGAHKNHLKHIHVTLPIGLLTCITGVSGSGKSTLVFDTIYKFFSQKLYPIQAQPIAVTQITGEDHIDSVIHIDQRPIGLTPHSIPATYTKVFDLIREFFAQLPDSQTRGYSASRYSFNVKGGRCETCSGNGVIEMQMHFLPSAFRPCDACQGKRYNRETLEIHYRGKNIADVLEMTVDEALSFFQTLPKVYLKLKTLQEVGLGYLQLGQSTVTLSGGEAQRIKLSKELSKRSTGKTLYILDEPSTGLHVEDIQKLICILQTLTSQGNTVIVIEHNLEIIKTADYIIDLGPAGGEEGGFVLAMGTPEEVALNPKSDTGRFLKRYLREPISIPQKVLKI